MWKPSISAASRQFGYTFGDEGVVTMKEACRLLGMCRDTVKLKAAAGQIRIGSDGGRIKLCRRSIREYLATLES